MAIRSGFPGALGTDAHRPFAAIRHETPPRHCHRKELAVVRRHLSLSPPFFSFLSNTRFST
jgi:hypothetical protein